MMHADEKHQSFTDKVVEHQAPLIKELEAIATKLGVQLPDFMKNAIKYSNAKNNKVSYVTMCSLCLTKFSRRARCHLESRSTKG